MASEGAVVLSYENSLLRESDVALLSAPRWLNDNIIAFWFEYLEYEMYKNYSDSIALISPQVTQYIKCGQPEDVNIMVQPLELHRKLLVFLAINDCTAQSSPGGSHWSLLMYNGLNKTFEHYDSHSGSVNRLQAENIATVLLPYLFYGSKHIPEEPLVYEKECTQQVNSYDCGVHVICNTEALCRIFCHKDPRHISEIVTTRVVHEARGELKKLIYSLRKK